MTLEKCPECGNQVSRAASSCPSCGHPLKNPKSNSRYTKIVVTIILIVVLVPLLGFAGCVAGCQLSQGQGNTMLSIYTNDGKHEQITAGELKKAYMEDEEAAKDKYFGAPISFTAEFIEHGESYDNVMNGGIGKQYYNYANFNGGIEVEYGMDYSDLIESLKKGDMVEVKGEIWNADGWTIELKNINGNENTFKKAD